MKRRAWESWIHEVELRVRILLFQLLHLFFGSRGNLALEYQMPAASSMGRRGPAGTTTREHRQP